MLGERFPVSGDMPDSASSVAKVATEMMPFFGDKFDRRMVALQQIAGTNREAEVWHEIQKHIRQAEDQAEKTITESPPSRRPLSMW